MTDDYLAALRASGTATGKFIFDISRFYREFHLGFYGLEGIHTHDPSAIAWVIDPTLFSAKCGPVRVITGGVAAGRTLLDERQHWINTNAWSDRPAVNVCTGVDSERLLALYKERIETAD
jgi:inosine-uridine nucleoside N-ribohydrolase